MCIRIISKRSQGLDSEWHERITHDRKYSEQHFSIEEEILNQQFQFEQLMSVNKKLMPTFTLLLGPNPTHNFILLMIFLTSHSILSPC